VLILLLIAPIAAKRIKGQSTDSWETSLTLKKPFLTSDGKILENDWKTAGSAVVQQNLIKLTPNEPSKEGLIYNTESLKGDNWEVALQFGVSRGVQDHGEGVALWLLEKPGVTGPAFGSSTQWKGLGVIYDSRDDYEDENEGSEADVKSGGPYITIQTNDGSHELVPLESKSDELAGCSIKNIPEEGLPKVYSMKMKVRYINGLLSVMYKTKASSAYESCATNVPVKLPKNLHLQFSASTDEMATDSHSLYSLKYYDLDPISTETRDIQDAQLKEIEDQEEAQHPLNTEKKVKGRKVKEPKKETNVGIPGTTAAVVNPPEKPVQVTHTSISGEHIEGLSSAVRAYQESANKYTSQHNQLIEGVNKVLRVDRQQTIEGIQIEMEKLSVSVEAHKRLTLSKRETISFAGSPFGKSLETMKHDMAEIRDQSKNLFGELSSTSFANLQSALLGCVSDTEKYRESEQRVVEHSGWGEVSGGLSKGHYLLIVETVAVLGFFLLKMKRRSGKRNPVLY